MISPSDMGSLLGAYLACMAMMALPIIVEAQPAREGHDEPPRLENAEEIRALLEELYPADLKEAGKGGVVDLWIRVDEEGEVAEVRVAASSGEERLDSAAMKVAEAMRWVPSRDRSGPRVVWVRQKLRFGEPRGLGVESSG